MTQQSILKGMCGHHHRTRGQLAWLHTLGNSSHPQDLLHHPHHPHRLHISAGCRRALLSYRCRGYSRPVEHSSKRYSRDRCTAIGSFRRDTNPHPSRSLWPPLKVWLQWHIWIWIGECLAKLSMGKYTHTCLLWNTQFHTLLTQNLLAIVHIIIIIADM